MYWSQEGQNPKISHEPCQDLHLYTVQNRVNEILTQDNPVQKGIFMLPKACTNIPSVAVVPKAQRYIRARVDGLETWAKKKESDKHPIPSFTAETEGLKRIRCFFSLNQGKKCIHLTASEAIKSHGQETRTAALIALPTRSTPRK